MNAQILFALFPPYRSEIICRIVLNKIIVLEFFTEIYYIKYIFLYFTEVSAMDGFSDKIKIPVSEGCTRVMSFNVRCGEFEPRQRIVPQIIGEYLPDTLGVQECTYE